MEEIDDEIEIVSRPTKSKSKPRHNDEPRTMKLSEKHDRKKITHPSPPKEIKTISVISRRDQ